MQRALCGMAWLTRARCVHAPSLLPQRSSSMSMFKGLAAGAAGAAAYNLYHDADLSSGKSLASAAFEVFQKKGAAQVAEVRRG